MHPGAGAKGVSSEGATHQVLQAGLESWRAILKRSKSEEGLKASYLIL